MELVADKNFFLELQKHALYISFSKKLFVDKPNPMLLIKLALRVVCLRCFDSTVEVSKNFNNFFA